MKTFLFTSQVSFQSSVSRIQNFTLWGKKDFNDVQLWSSNVEGNSFFNLFSQRELKRMGIELLCLFFLFLGRHDHVQGKTWALRYIAFMVCLTNLSFGSETRSEVIFYLTGLIAFLPLSEHFNKLQADARLFTAYALGLK